MHAKVVPVAGGGTARPKPSRRKGPGRPEGGGAENLPQTILDAAEVVFAERGYAGTTLREVADRASVTQALIGYYYGSKHGLFDATFLRRGRDISEQRVKNLAQLRVARRKPTLEQIVRAFLLPTLQLRKTPSGRAFLRLQARLHTEPREVSYALRQQAYDESTVLYIEALREALPQLPETDIYWRVALMVGAYMYVFSDTHRLDELAPGICDLDDADEIISQITRFVVGGLKAGAKAA